ncbi:MAG: hypothetical protein R2709_02340 [Marmoricola sp.]
MQARVVDQQPGNGRGQEFAGHERTCGGLGSNGLVEQAAPPPTDSGSAIALKPISAAMAGHPRNSRVHPLLP